MGKLLHRCLEATDMISIGIVSWSALLKIVVMYVAIDANDDLCVCTREDGQDRLNGMNILLLQELQAAGEC